jgi:hypothetical protein
VGDRGLPHQDVKVTALLIGVAWIERGDTAVGMLLGLAFSSPDHVVCGNEEHHAHLTYQAKGCTVTPKLPL